MSQVELPGAYTVFASGALLGQRQDVANSPVVRFGTLQEVAVDFGADVRDLYDAEARHPRMHAPAKSKVEIKAKQASVRARLFNDLYYGGTLSGTSISLNNYQQRLGVGPSFTLMVANAVDYWRQLVIVFPLCRSSKLSFPFRIDDYAIEEFDVTVSADKAGNVAQLSFYYASQTGPDLLATAFDLSIPEWSGYNEIMGIW
jgi:hypothetical protein